MDPIQKLIEELAHFPGVGPRQAKRFAYYLLTKDERRLKAFTELLVNARKTVLPCADCGRLFSHGTQNTARCPLCADKSRDNGFLMVVGHDVDVESVEKSGSYRGYYFVLGGTIPFLEEKPEERVRLAPLRTQVTGRLGNGLKEIILALDLHPEGEHTMEYLAKFLSPLVQGKEVKITVLGRGLSTGTELQYSDPETIKNALSNRSAAN